MYFNSFLLKILPLTDQLIKLSSLTKLAQDYGRKLVEIKFDFLEHENSTNPCQNFTIDGFENCSSTAQIGNDLAYKFHDSLDTSQIINVENTNNQEVNDTLPLISHEEINLRYNRLEISGFCNKWRLINDGDDNSFTFDLKNVKCGYNELNYNQTMKFLTNKRVIPVDIVKTCLSIAEQSDYFKKGYLVICNIPIMDKKSLYSMKSYDEVFKNFLFELGVENVIFEENNSQVRFECRLPCRVLNFSNP